MIQWYVEGIKPEYHSPITHMQGSIPKEYKLTVENIGKRVLQNLIVRDEEHRAELSWYAKAGFVDILHIGHLLPGKRKSFWARAMNNITRVEGPVLIRIFET